MLPPYKLAVEEIRRILTSTILLLILLNYKESKILNDLQTSAATVA